MLISGWQRKVWHLNMTYDGTGSVEGGTGWYLVVLGQYRLVLVDIWWYWVSIGLLCLYILKKVKIWSDVTIAGQRTTEQGKIGLLSQWTMDDWDEQIIWSRRLQCFYRLWLFMDYVLVNILPKKEFMTKKLGIHIPEYLITHKTGWKYITKNITFSF